MAEKTLLILGGTAEARGLALAAVKAWPKMRVVTSLAGRTQAPAAISGEVVSGGFGGADGLAGFIKEEKVDLLVDATHPFAAHMSDNAVTAARRAKVPLLRLERRAWTFDNAPTVREVPGFEAAARTLNADPDIRRVFLAIGRQELAPFGQLQHLFFLLRFVDSPSEWPPFKNCQVVTGRPGRVEQERELLKSYRIDTLVAKNSGGGVSRRKIDAAIALGVNVILIARPPRSDAPHAETVEQAVAWIGEQFNR